jgi:hypothetical protein
MSTPETRRVSCTAFPSLLSSQRRSRKLVKATRESRTCFWSRKTAEIFSARFRRSASGSSLATRTGATIAVGLTLV